MAPRTIRLLAIIGVLLALLLVSAGLLAQRFPYYCFICTIDRRSGETFYITVTHWFFQTKESAIREGEFHLSELGGLTAPDVTLIANRAVRQWYPWSEDDDNAEDEEYEPGMTLWRARWLLFQQLDVSTISEHYPKAYLDSIRKARIEIWNSPRLELHPEIVLKEPNAENDRLFKELPRQSP